MVAQGDDMGNPGAAAALARACDWINEQVGRRLMWLAALLVLVQFAVVVLRYLFGTSFIAMQESVIYIHATLFMLTIGYTFLHDGHVRVDVIYAGFGPRGRALVDLVGTLVAVLPFCALVLWFSWGFVGASWKMREGPMFVGGLPFVYLLKTTIPLFAGLLLLQGIATAIKAAMVLAGREVRVFEGGHSGEEAGK
jgi:TRAP-type mannitol/chloroaromatic compound transport system permease small subunit